MYVLMNKYTIGFNVEELLHHTTETDLIHCFNYVIYKHNTLVHLHSYERQCQNSVLANDIETFLSRASNVFLSDNIVGKVTIELKTNTLLIHVEVING